VDRQERSCYGGMGDGHSQSTEELGCLAEGSSTYEAQSVGREGQCDSPARSISCWMRLSILRKLTMLITPTHLVDQKQNLNGASAGQPTFLNIGAPHPDPRRFIGVIWGQYRSSFPMLPEYLYKDRTICVFGRIEPYDGVAEIIITGSGQIQIEQDQLILKGVNWRKYLPCQDHLFNVGQLAVPLASQHNSTPARQPDSKKERAGSPDPALDTRYYFIKMIPYGWYLSPIRRDNYASCEDPHQSSGDDPQAHLR
jgi:hypothetical protein